MLDRLTNLFEPTPRTGEAWLVRMGRPQVSTRDLTAFEAWLDGDNTRLDEYQALKATQRQARTLKADLTAELSQIPRQRRTSKSASRGLLIGGPVLAALSVAVLLVAVWGDLPFLHPADPMAGAAIYSTTVGEIRQVQLADGSQVTLDTGSAIRVVLAEDARHVILDRGRAYFDVFHDAARPFDVALADRQVTVTGTRFTTALAGGAASVALLEGSVSLSSKSGPVLHMRPGDEVSYHGGLMAQTVNHVDPAETAPWRNRQLVFRDEPLSEVLAELSRYTPVHLKMDDPALRRLRVTAVFPLDGDSSIIERIDQLLPVSTGSSEAGVVTVRPE
ncbi:MAG TPA: FecR domain-containing protein [Brevundimonas sp.]|jgi:transmembrane sensor